MEKVLILGNGQSRLDKSQFIREWNHQIWVCNLAGYEFGPLGHIDVVGTVHGWVTKEMIKLRKERTLYFRILSQEASEGVEVFKTYRGWSTGLQLVQEAIDEEYKEIYLSGFCFINDDKTDIYTQNIVTSNFSDQWKIIQKEKPEDVKFIFI